MEKKFAKGTPVSRHDAAYAREHDELPLYRLTLPARKQLRKPLRTIMETTG